MCVTIVLNVIVIIKWLVIFITALLLLFMLDCYLKSFWESLVLTLAELSVLLKLTKIISTRKNRHIDELEVVCFAIICL